MPGTKTNCLKELSRLSNVIGLIYEGATDPTRWVPDILPAMCEYIQAPGCLLFSSLHTPQNGGYAFTHGLSQEFLDLYMNKYQPQDIWTIAAFKHDLFHEGTVAIGEDFVSREELLASTFYKECMSVEPNGGQLLASVIYGADSRVALPAVCSYTRSLQAPNFGTTELDRQKLLMPHLSRSLAVMQRLRAAELTATATLASLDRLPSGVLLLNERGHVAFANRVAQQMLEKGDGLYLRQSQNISGLGRLDTDSAAMANDIDTAILATLRRDPYNTPHFSKSVSVPRTSGFGSYTLQFSALGNLNEFGGGASGYQAIVFVADSAQKPNIDPKVLQDTYRLTPAEGAAAIALLEHDSIKEAARALNNSPSTVQTQLKQIYLKLGVDSRTRFVKVMLGLASPKT